METKLTNAVFFLQGLLGLVIIASGIVLYFFVKGIDELKHAWHEIEHPGEDESLKNK